MLTVFTCLTHIFFSSSPCKENIQLSSCFFSSFGYRIKALWRIYFRFVVFFCWYYYCWLCYNSLALSLAGAFHVLFFFLERAFLISPLTFLLLLLFTHTSFVCSYGLRICSAIFFCISIFFWFATNIHNVSLLRLFVFYCVFPYCPGIWPLVNVSLLLLSSAS